VKLDATTAKLVLGSPDASPETLADIARDFPDLQAQVARHPNVPPELLAWLSQYGTPEAEAVAAARQAGTVPPERIGVRQRRLFVTVAVILVVVAVAIWLLVAPPWRTAQPSGIDSGEPTIPTAPAPANVTWLSLANVGIAYLDQVFDVGNNVLVLTGESGVNPFDGSHTVVAAVDATTGKSLWSLNVPLVDLGSNTYQGASVKAGGGAVVVLRGSQVQVLDAATGTVAQTTTIDNQGGPVTLVGGVLLAYDGTTVTAHPIDDLGTTLWQAEFATMSLGPSDGIFGSGEWIDTNNGVLDVATGQPASFGADAHVSTDGSSGVSYDGPGQGDVIRTDCVSGTCDRAIWNPSTDSGSGDLLVTSGVAAKVLRPICADQASPYFVLTQTQTNTSSTSTTMTAYSWQTGRPLWSAATDSSDCGQFAGGTYVKQDANLNVVAMGGTTAQPIWTGHADSVTTDQGIAYLVSGTTMTAYDGNNGFAQLWSIQLPADGVQLQSVAGHLIATVSSPSYAWVLSGQ